MIKFATARKLRIFAARSVPLILSLIFHVNSQSELPQLQYDNYGPGIREQVRKVYDEARRNPRDPNAVGRLGMILETYEDHASAIACFESARKLAPADFQWIYYQAIAQSNAGNADGAISNFQEALKLDPAYLPARLRLADLYFATGQTDASLRIYESIIAKDRDAVLAVYGIGRVKASQGDHNSAATYLLRAVEISALFGAAHYALAMTYRRLGQPAKAAEHLALYSQNRLIRPAMPDPLLDSIKAMNSSAADHLRKGVELDSAGKTSEAIDEHLRAIEIDPQYEQARTNLITLYARAGQPDKAERQYRSLLSINPNIAESHYNFGVLMIEQNRIEEAEQAFRRCLEINPFHAEANLNLGMLLERRAKYDEALNHYQAAVENRSDLREAHFQLARMLIYKGRTPEAIDHLRRTLALEDENAPRYAYALGAAYARNGDRINALKHIRNARALAEKWKQTALLAQIEIDLKKLEEK